MPSEGFEPATPETKRPQTYALDRAATEVGVNTDIRLIRTTYPGISPY
jgi:hypothetical protein